MSSVIHIGGDSPRALLVLVHVAELVVIGRYANKLAVSRRAAQRQLHAQAWQLRQLIA